MAITKTKFINYTRCPRYVSLDNLNLKKLDSMVTYEEYKKELEEEKINEIVSSMFDEDGNDLLNVKDEQLEVMLPYYNEVEILAGNIAKKHFKGSFKFAYNTKDQESFDCLINGIRYICYVDIYNEFNDSFNIIEVKATSSKKFLDLSYKENGIKNCIFEFKNGIYYLKEDLGIECNNKYYECRNKLFDRLSGAGHYIYDLAVQRYIIENDLKQNNQISKIGNIKYYLAVLNSEYVFNGEYENGIPIYKEDINNNDIISYFDVTSLTKDYLEYIDIDRKRIESYISNLDVSKVSIGEHCEHKKRTKCRYQGICWDFLPKENSLLQYLDSHNGFKDELGNKYDRFELINNNILSMTDIPKNYLNRKKNLIQREVVESKIPYFNKDKIKDGIKQIKYPIYHLDFETFPSPLPRFKGEKPYTQSVFQFSLHVEDEYGCDKIKNHYGYLASDHEDNREELIKELIKRIDNYEGTVLVYNESFEKARLKELASIYPMYSSELLKIRDMVFDLMNIVKTKSSLYEKLGYSKEEASLFNYYHEDMQGSFSIKKILPLFSNLTYKGMEIGNGVEALVTYAKFDKMNKKEFDFKYEKLIEYCRQDTWAMVEILKGLKELVK